MSFDALLFQALNGLASASGLFFVGAGLSLIFGVTRIVNIAHGSLYMLGIYIAYSISTKVGGGLGFWGSLLLAPLLVAAIGAAIWVENGAIANAGIGLSALGNVLRASRAEDALKGKPPSDESFAAVADMVAEDCSPTTDGRGSEEYKRHLAAELTRRALRRAANRVSEEV